MPEITLLGQSGQVKSFVIANLPLLGGPVTIRWPRNIAHKLWIPRLCRCIVQSPKILALFISFVNSENVQSGQVFFGPIFQNLGAPTDAGGRSVQYHVATQ